MLDVHPKILDQIENVSNLKFENREFLLQQMWNEYPVGWHELIKEGFRFKDKLGIGWIVDKCSVEKGLLRMSVYQNASLEFVESIDAKMAKRYFQALALESCRTCMVCGKWGAWRRKYDAGWPPLCGPHNIIYANYIDTRKV